MAQPYIPPLHLDIVEMIIEQLYMSSAQLGAPWPESVAQKRDLHSCTLVCRRWKNPARKYLFRKVSYSYSDEDAVFSPAQLHDEARWADVQESEGHNDFQPVWAPTKTLKDFVRFIRRDEAAGKSVRILYLSEHHLGSATPPNSMHFAALLFVLPHLRHLILWNVRTPPSPFRNPVRNRRLDSLYIVFDRPARGLSASDSAARVLGYVGAVGSLGFSVPHEGDASAVALEALPLRVRPDAIRFDLPHGLPAGLVRRLAAKPATLARTRFLQLGGVVNGADSLDALMRLLHAAAPTLERLTLASGIVRLVTVFPLARFAALEYLCVAYTLPCERPVACCAAADEVAAFLAACAGGGGVRLRMLTLYARLQAPAGLAGWAAWPSANAVWTLRDNELDDAVLAFVRRTRVPLVRLECSVQRGGAVSRRMAERVLRPMFPRLEEQSYFVVEHTTRS